MTKKVEDRVLILLNGAGDADDEDEDDALLLTCSSPQERPSLSPLHILAKRPGGYLP